MAGPDDMQWFRTYRHSCRGRPLGGRVGSWPVRSFRFDSLEYNLANIPSGRIGMILERWRTRAPRRSCVYRADIRRRLQTKWHVVY